MAHEFIHNGGVTSPAGFRAAGAAAGIKSSGDTDVAVLASDAAATAAGAFTSNAFQSPAVTYDRRILAVGRTVRAVVVNSGNANACTALQGLQDARTTATRAADALGVQSDEVLVSSTGRIGVPLPMDLLLPAVDAAVAALSPDGGTAAAEAIMTTDTRPKSGAVALDLGGCTVHIGGMTKGAGMIAPKLRLQTPEATMLAYVTTDAAVSRQALDACLGASLDLSFNRITVDGDCSTNDTVLALANGVAGNAVLRVDSPEFPAFRDAFVALVSHLAREMVLDGEGVTRFVEVEVRGAATDAEARTCAEAIANSALCKTAWFGADPNWGRVLCAAGYAGVKLDPDRVALDYEGLPVVRGGQDAGTPEDVLAKAIDKREFRMELDLGVGPGAFTIWTCDLSYEYVEINADYHT